MTCRASLAVVIALACCPAVASAQLLGTFRWQLQPFCNVITLRVTQQGAVYTLDGTDDLCGAQQSASVDGIAFLNPNGLVGFGLHLVLPGGTPLAVESTLDLASLNGSWRDSADNSGSLILTPGASVGGAPRPMPAGTLLANSVATAQIVDGSITAADLAPASVTRQHLAAGAVGPLQLDEGAVTGAHILDGTIHCSDLAAGAVNGRTIDSSSVSGAHIVNGSVTAADLAPDAVTGAHILDGSITVADLGDRVRLESSEYGDSLLLPDGVDTTVSQVFLQTMTAGRVLASVSGSFTFGHYGAATDSVVCSITTGTTVTPPLAAAAKESSPASTSLGTVSFGGTRVFSVAAASDTTFRFVCRSTGQNWVDTPVMTVLFVPGP